MTDDKLATRAEVDAVDERLKQSEALVSSLLDRVEGLVEDAAASESTVRTLQRDLAEVAHDLTALASEAGALLGEPFASRAQDIVTKRQTDTTTNGRA